MSREISNRLPTGRPRGLDYADLDPFALPTETDGRYRILGAAALVLVWSAAALTTPGLLLRNAELTLPPDHRAIQSKVVDGGIESLTPEELAVLSDPAVVRPYARALARWLARIGISIALVVSTLAGAAAIYRFHPRWRGLLRKVSPISAEDAPEVVRDLRHLIRRAGLPAGISLTSTPGRFDGLAFGTGGRETIALGCPPDLLGAAWERVMRPVAYHELGHIANRDIRKQEISRGLWIAALTLLLVLGYSKLLTLGVASMAPQWAALVRNVPFLLGVAWMWRGLVRAREHYADLRAVTWGERTGLLRRLGVAPTARPWWDRLPAIVGRWVRRVGAAGILERLREHGWSSHPTRAERAAVIEDPRRLFEVSSELALLTGLLLTTVLGSMGLLFDDLVFAARSLTTLCILFLRPAAALAVVVLALGAMMGVAHLVTGALGVQVQREAVAHASVETGESWGYARQGRVAFAFALGVELGLLATPASFLLAEIPALFVVAWLVAFTALTWMWLVFLRAVSRLLLATHTGRHRPRRRRVLVSWVSAFLLSVLYSPALAARVTLHRMPEPGSPVIGPAPPPEALHEFLVVFVMTSLALLALGLALYALVGLATMASVAAWLRLRRPECSACGALTSTRIVAGRMCASCGEPLAAWFVLNRDLAEGGVP